MSREIPKVLIIFGTRPEAIKLAPVIKELTSSKRLKTVVCNTGQHDVMVTDVLSVFNIVPDYNLKVMRDRQSLTALTNRLMQHLSDTIRQTNPAMVVVHGDTTTAFCAALAAYYEQVPVAHIEAGLRTYNICRPFPEEANRQLISRLASLHFCPTAENEANILEEKLNYEKTFVTGNTVVDALQMVLSDLDSGETKINTELYGDAWTKINNQNFKFKVLVTGHRRENLGVGIENICEAIRTLSIRNADMLTVFPVHLNPSVKDTVHNKLSGLHNVALTPPLPYLEFVYLMRSCDLIITDSGGIQEEAPSLGVKVLVTREETERGLAIDTGLATLTGTDKDLIISSTQKIKKQAIAGHRLNVDHNPFGRGNASKQIRRAIEKHILLD